MKPQWTIYKNDHAIGQAITWHKALDMLTRQEALNAYNVFHHYGYISIETSVETDTSLYPIYKITKDN